MAPAPGDRAVGDPGWTLSETGDHLQRRITETLFTLGAGGFGTRGSVEERVPDSVELVVCAGVYAGAGPTDGLLPCPTWTRLDVDLDDSGPTPCDDRRMLDLRTGVLERTATRPDGAVLHTLRFASIARPGLVALRASGSTEVLRGGGGPLHAPGGVVSTTGVARGRQWIRVLARTGTGVAAVGHERAEVTGSGRVVERVAAYAPDRPRVTGLTGARSILDGASDLGFDELLAEHRVEWDRRWAAVDVAIPADPEAQLAVRFAVFQLWGNVARHDEMAVGARGVSGNGYAGHVFWDADAFVLPAMAAIDPQAAAAMIRYRCRRLGAARRWARNSGRAGARFPWEAAATGGDVTPRESALGSELVPIRTGSEEEHITADVAWAVLHHHAWAGHDRLPGSHRAVLVETARYWASRVRPELDGSLHIEGVIGPDEYHDDVADNAFTNGMARWNLRAAARAAGPDVAPDEVARWLDLAERIVDGYDPGRGLYEQFRGYFALEPLVVADVAEPPVAVDLKLGRDRVRRSQLIKQPDVLMLHHLVPDEVRRGSLGPNVDFYGPRTAHGSSLSPSVSAALLARAGRADEALALFRIAARLDIGDTTGMTAAGLHMANLGGLWQCLVGGFLGARVRGGVLTLDPCLPSSWPELEVRMRCLGRRVRVRVDRGEVLVAGDGPVRVRLGDGPVVEVAGPTDLATGRRRSDMAPAGGRS